jgi:hypothetical protein
MTCGAHLSARRGEARALSYDGGGNWAGRRRSTRACWAGAVGWANSIGKKKKNQNGFDF